MTQGRKRVIWILVILALIIGGVVGYMIYSKEGVRKERKVITKEVPPSERNALPVKAVPEEKVKREEASPERESKEAESPPSKKARCAQIEQEVKDFFDYLDQKPYVRRLIPEKTSFECFKEIMKDLGSTPPVPAGEGRRSEYLIANVYHFFRVLDQKDLHLVREVIRKEQDSLEVNLATFYKWLMATECPDPEGLRPGMDVLYKYSGFLLNTIGGRAYLSRRAPRARLLLSYYGILILHEADRRGKNEYGINVSRMVPPLVEEIQHYPELRFREKYLSTLTNIMDYYK